MRATSRRRETARAPKEVADRHARPRPRFKVFDLPATGDIPYHYAILMHPFAEDTWVQGVQITTVNPRSLHHSNLAFIKITEGFNPDNFITGYVPGGEAMNLDSGIGFLIPKGSVLGLQIHVVSTGKPEKAKVSVGLRYPREVVTKQLRCMQIFDTRFAIAPGAPAHKVAASGRLDHDAVGVGLFAHMHLRGKDMTFTAHTPNTTPETLLIIPNYNSRGRSRTAGSRARAISRARDWSGPLRQLPFNPSPESEGDGTERPPDTPGDDVRLLLLRPREGRVAIRSIEDRTVRAGRRSLNSRRSNGRCYFSVYKPPLPVTGSSRRLDFPLFCAFQSARRTRMGGTAARLDIRGHRHSDCRPIIHDRPTSRIACIFDPPVSIFIIA